MKCPMRLLRMSILGQLPVAHCQRTMCIQLREKHFPHRLSNSLKKSVLVRFKSSDEKSVVDSVLPWHVPLAVWKSAIIRFSAPSVESLVWLVTNLALLFSEKVPSSSCSISSPSTGNDTPNRPICWVSGEVRAACVAVQVISYCDMVFNVCIEIQICKCWQQFSS